MAGTALIAVTMFLPSLSAAVLLWRARQQAVTAPG